MTQLGERQKLEMLEVLIAVEKEARTRDWFVKDRKEATPYLLQIGFIKEDKSYPGALHPQPFRLTEGGGAFLENVRARIGENGNINWHRLNEIEFPALEGQEAMLNEQDLRELEIFSLFVEACPLAIRSDSIEKRQPCEPDILCETSEGSVAFEMGQSIDEGFARQVADIKKLQTQLKDAFQNLPTDARSDLENRLGDAVIRVVFHQQTSKPKRESAIPQILEWLRQISPSCAGIIQPESDLSKEVKHAIIVRNNLIRKPEFEIDASGWLADQTLNLIDKKFGKNYNSSVPIELLIYYQLPPVLPERLWPKLRGFLEQRLQNSRFRRVWVFDAKEKTILFVYPLGQS